MILDSKQSHQKGLSTEPPPHQTDKPSCTLWDLPSDRWDALQRDPGVTLSPTDQDAPLTLPDYFLDQVRKFLNKDSPH